LSLTTAPAPSGGEHAQWRREGVVGDDGPASRWRRGRGCDAGWTRGGSVPTAATARSLIRNLMFRLRVAQAALCNGAARGARGGPQLQSSPVIVIFFSRRREGRGAVACDHGLCGWAGCTATWGRLLAGSVPAAAWGRQLRRTGATVVRFPVCVAEGQWRAAAGCTTTWWQLPAGMAPAAACGATGAGLALRRTRRAWGACQRHLEAGRRCGCSSSEWASGAPAGRARRAAFGGAGFGAAAQGARSGLQRVACCATGLPCAG
jgi:hypothetical protein